MTNLTLRRGCLSCVLVAAVAVIHGCAGYRVGNESLYRPDIRTIAVPVFQSDSFRRFFGERLTEAVIKEIELRTPYKVTQGSVADSVLFGRVREEYKFTIIENINDYPRDIELELVVEVSWRGRGGEMIMQPEIIRLPTGGVEIGQAVNFIPEAGQSLTTAQQVLLQRTAEQIVARLEVPW